MSRPQEPHRPFFSFGNPFRMISPKGSQLSPKLLSVLNSFEETLAERLRKLNPKDKDDLLSLTWMKCAMDSLCETHEDIKTLITDLELPITDWDDKWIDLYLDISVKLLDICIAFSSELSRLNQGHLLLQCVLHNLESSSSKQFIRARSSLDSWRQHMNSKNQRIRNCCSILNSLVGSLDLPKVKNSAKGKVLMRAMYGVKVHTIFVCSVFATAFSGCAENFLRLDVADSILWGQAYLDLQNNVNVEKREIFSGGKFSVLKELDTVEIAVNKLYPLIQDGLQPMEVEESQKSVSDLRRGAEKLSQGLDVVANRVDGFFKIVLSGRDALLCNLRTSGVDPMLGTNVEQIVR